MPTLYVHITIENYIFKEYDKNGNTERDAV